MLIDIITRETVQKTAEDWGIGQFIKLPTGLLKARCLRNEFVVLLITNLNPIRLPRAS